MSDSHNQTQPSPPKASHGLLHVIFHHPLASIFVGFLLTGVVGTVLTNRMAAQRQHEAEAVHLRDTRREAVRALSRLLSERAVHMQMLINGIEQKSPPAVLADLKRRYDETEGKWALQRQDTMLLAREILGESDYATWRAEMEERLAKRRIQPLRKCLEKAYAVAAAGGDGNAVLSEGKAAQTLQECAAASEMFVDALYDLAVLMSPDAPKGEADRVRERFQSQLKKVCP